MNYEPVVSSILRIQGYVATQTIVKNFYYHVPPYALPNAWGVHDSKFFITMYPLRIAQCVGGT